MLINESEVEKRLNNPLNLLNRMKSGLTSQVKKDAMSLFVKKEEKEEKEERPDFEFNKVSPEVISTNTPAKVTTPLPSSSPSSDDLIDDNDSKIKLAIAHDSALDLLTNSLNSLNLKVRDNEIKASSMPSIISSASRVITDIRKERLEREKGKESENVHYHFYCPIQKSISDYEVIEVAG